MTELKQHKSQGAKGIQLVLGCLISVAMLYLVFRDIDIGVLLTSLGSMAWWPFIPFLVLFFAHFIFRSLRWRFLLPLPSGAEVSVRQLFDALLLGNLASFILPFRLGEFVRPLILSRWSEYTFASSFVSVIIERFFDLSAVLLSFAIIVPLLPEIPSWAVIGSQSLGVLAAGLLLFLALSAFLPNLVRFCAARFFVLLPERVARTLEVFLEDMLAGAAVIRTPSRLIAIVSLTALVWFTAFLQFYVVLFIFPFQHSFLLAVTIGVFVALAIALPSAPGFIGVFQAGCVAACKLFSYPSEGAVAYALVIHLASYLLFIGIGFWLLSVHDLKLFELKRAVEGD